MTVAVEGRSVDITTPDGTTDAYVVHPDDDAKHPGVLFYMDGFGLRPSLLAMADRLAAHGYTVLLANVFYRHGRTPVVDLPAHIDTAQRPDIFERVLPMIIELTAEPVIRDAGAYLDWLAQHPHTAEGPVGTTGYCMGGVLALRAAAAFPDRIAAVAGFHGGPLVTEAPDSPHRLVESMTAELYYGHAGGDVEKSPEQFARFDEALDDADLRYTTEVYEGAQHGYTQADTAAYDADAAERHWVALVDLFGRTLNA
ncbi:dienelactone hydrolase family protein [Nocardia callitridis]|uniref:Dienelactone hydrolase family protein n=1 Tax=Nocardia callitridis TaxID=648753 RepID=A0ABP9K8A8_9NOCA